MVYWITGKSGAGKTTLAYKMAYNMLANGDQRVVVLDGANIRQFFPESDFSEEGRHRHIMTVARYAAIIERQGFTVIIELFSPKKEWRQEAAKLFKEMQLIYCPGGTLWPGTEYEEPNKEEMVGMIK